MKIIKRVVCAFVIPFELIGIAYNQYELVRKLVTIIVISAIGIWGFIFYRLSEIPFWIVVVLGLLLYTIVMSLFYKNTT